MAATSSPALPAFSYAQAAKGRASAVSVPHPQPESSHTTPDLQIAEKKSPTPQSEVSNPPHTSSDDVPGAVKDGQAHKFVASKAARDDTGTPSGRRSGSEPNVAVTAKPPPAGSHSDPKQTLESTPPISVSPEATLPRDDDLASNPNGNPEMWERQSEASTTIEKSSQQLMDVGKEKPGDEDWTKVPASKTESELRAAPVPTVNIWQQRREAQEAKAKANAALRSSTPVTAAVGPKPSSQSARSVDTAIPDEEAKRRHHGRAAEKGDASPKKKQADEMKLRDDGKKFSRQGKAGEPKKDASTISTVSAPVDAASWPTPEIANHEEKKKPHAQDKGEKNDSKSPGIKPNQKWVPVPYVPTARFNTPLPPTASRRGGRPARGSREGVNRGGGHLVQGTAYDKPEKIRSAGLPSGPRQSSEQQRGRGQEALGGDRATSEPSHPPRAASAGPTLADNRRSAPTAMSERDASEFKKRQRGDMQDVSFGGISSSHESTPSNQARGGSASFSRQSSSSFRAGTHDHPRRVSGESHAHPAAHAGAERRNIHDENERHGDVVVRRERAATRRDSFKTRDFDSRSESWRDREPGGERPEQRSGRGRGGYRGRGTHSNYAHGPPVQTHAFTAPLPQQAFSAGKSHGHGPRHRQSSTPFNGMPPPSHQRSSSRSQSIPSQSFYHGMPNAFASPLSPTQTDVNAMYAGYPAMYPGMMGAVPYSPALEPAALMSMVSTQLEYYFSIENLCKDMYLRSNMDSQGWVPLRVIAGFNRIKSLTEEMSLIRHVCQMSRNIEFQPGEDGMDRVRKLDKWEQWILDVEQRQAHAQTDGPQPPSFLPATQSPSHGHSVFPPTSQVASPAWASGPFYSSYPAEAPNFGAAAVPLENHNTISSPTPGPLPDIPSGEDFSLSNGRIGYGPGQPADALNRSSPVAQAQGIIPNGFSPALSGVAVVNGDRATSPPQIGVENAFSNERMNELHVCVRHPTQQLQPPFMSSASRTFSHGSLDGTVPDNERAVSPMPALRGGAGSPDHKSGAPRDRSSFFERAGNRSDRGVFWMKDGAPPDSWDQEGSTVERYQSLHDRALAERMPGIATDDLDWLYQFWSHFLVRNFNHDMYHDFRSLAWDDAEAGYDGGLERLGQYYGALLTGPRVLTERLAEDIVKLAEFEMEDRRQMFCNLRSAWRNGAFSLKSRKMIDKFLNPNLKAALER